MKGFFMNTTINGLGGEEDYEEMAHEVVNDEIDLYNNHFNQIFLQNNSELGE
jgi:hypothetical protein